MFFPHGRANVSLERAEVVPQLSDSLASAHWLLLSILLSSLVTQGGELQ